MPSLNAIRLSWPEPESPDLLQAWEVRAQKLKILRADTKLAPSIRAALKHAAACRCAEIQPQLDAMTATVREERRLRMHAELEAEAKAAAPAPTLAAASSNPLRSMREAAGLKQPEAARLMGITRGALSQSEQRATVSAAMVERARKAWGVGS